MSATTALPLPLRLLEKLAMTGRICQDQASLATEVLNKQGVLAMFDYVRNGMSDADNRKLERFVRSFSMLESAGDMRRLMLAIGMCFYVI